MSAEASCSLPIASITVDLDTTPHYRAIHGLSELAQADFDATYRVGVRRLLDLFKERGVRATLFVIGEDVERDAHRALLAEAHASGHELANHSYSHRYDLRALPEAMIQREFQLAEEALERLTGECPVGFRAPGYNLDAWLLHLVRERGYLYDSSIFPCPPYYAAKAMVMAWLKLKGSASRSALTPPETLLAPIAPYRPAPGSVWRRAATPASPPLWEVPMALVPGARFPLIGTSLHLIGARGFEAMLPLLQRSYPELFQLEFHAIDFMDDRDLEELAAHQPDLKVPWEIKRARYGAILDALAERYRLDTLRAGVERLERLDPSS